MKRINYRKETLAMVDVLNGISPSGLRMRLVETLDCDKVYLVRGTNSEPERAYENWKIAYYCVGGEYAREYVYYRERQKEYEP